VQAAPWLRRLAHRSVETIDPAHPSINESIASGGLPMRKNFLRNMAARSVGAATLVTLFVSAQNVGAATAAPIDPGRTRVEFIVDGMGWARTKGRFTAFSGKITVDPRRPDASSVSFRIAAKSIEVGSSSFADYLRGDAFFDVQQYPDITFVSTAVEKVDERHALVTGDLTLRGVTHPFTVDVDVKRLGGRDNDRLNIRATGVLHRLEFGMSAGYPAISNEVGLVISTQAPAESQ
jgi:polyisoprenoid-binding protein YceI